MPLELARSKLLSEGDPEGALALLQAHIRQAPEAPAPRIFLFQLLCIQEAWHRALGQLDTLRKLDPSADLMVQAYQALIHCEILRESVFAGTQTPLVLGEPEPWIAQLLESIRGGSDTQLSARQKALELAPASSGSLNGVPFDWIADADTRLGPCFEFIINGKYYWAPVTAIERVQIDPPADLRDLVWLPCHLTLRSGAEVEAFMPVRYPAGASQPTEGSLLLSRETRWVGSPNWPEGIGQRMIATSAQDTALLDCRDITIDPARCLVSAMHG